MLAILEYSIKETGSAISTFVVGVESEDSYRTCTFTSPFSPSLVVTKTTPLAPLAPYRAVADASFKIEKLEISSGLSLDRSLDVISILSIRISGEVKPLPKEVTLRTKNCASSSPGAPVV